MKTKEFEVFLSLAARELFVERGTHSPSHSDLARFKC